ncbi:hypothetical protein GSY74_09370 [Sulfurovum sp. bin170]|uniref:hypothetical protein n=1 Tax=Sulfurovum sp. bin170 TaxID=2695268 RepID=UPI0013DFBCB6|nr:hypothetical protein [Sulfurovum sp. bin170]NEW61490.1 hypothetical protein [Sulfurovum sp. bin170]
MNKVWIVIPLLLLFSGCGGSSSSSTGVKIDTSEYFPDITTKEYTQLVKSVNDNRRVLLDFSENISLEQNLITIKVDDEITTISTIHKDNITIQEFGDKNRTITMEREVSIGDKVFENIQENLIKNLTLDVTIYGNKSISIKESCILESKINEFKFDTYHEYYNDDENHDIIKLKCTTLKTEITTIDPQYVGDVSAKDGIIEFKPNISYRYLQKGIGTIAIIDDDCIIEKSPEVIIDDTANPKDCIGEQYNYLLYHPEY